MSFFRICFTSFSLLFLSSCNFKLFAQTNNRKIDSLKLRLNKEKSDTQKINILIAIVKETKCEDVANKLSCANQAKILAEKLQWQTGIIRTDTTIGNVYYNCMKDYAKAISYFSQADSLAKSNNDGILQINTLHTLALYYQKTGEYKQSIDYYWHGLTLDVNLNEKIKIWNNLGIEYNNIGDYNLALTCYDNALKVLREYQKNEKELLCTIQMAEFLLNIGDIYMETAQPDEALKNYETAYNLGVTTKYKTIEIKGLIGIGDVCQFQKKYEDAIVNYQYALDNCDGPDYSHFKVKILNNLASSYLEKRNLDKVKETALSCIKLSEERTYNEQLPRAYITLGRAYTQQKDYSNARNCFQKALNISQQTGMLDDEKSVWFALYNTYKQLNHPVKALNAYEQFTKIRDSISNITKANEFIRQELDFKYKQEQLTEKLSLDQKIARQQMLAYSGYIGLTLVILLTFFIFRNYNTQKKYNELLSKEKQQQLIYIKEQDTVLTKIAHIQSHDVRGPVATILGLAQLFNYVDPADPINKEVIDGIAVVTEKLDTVIKEVIIVENRLKAGHKGNNV